jgi:hypothetical protein
MGRALEAVTASDARGFLEHAATTHWSNHYDKRSRRLLVTIFYRD